VNQTRHIVRKDLRRLRWLLVLWGVLLAGRVAFAAFRGAIDEAAVSEFALLQLSGMMGTLETILLALIAAQLVQDEPLVGLNAFWLTRPYSWRALLAAKLAIAAVAFVLLTLVADLATMTLFGAGPVAMARASSIFVASRLMWTLPLFVIAALTPSIAVFALTIIGAIAAFSLVVAILIGIATFSIDETETYLPLALPDPTTEIVGLIVFVIAAVAVIVYQYRHRRWPVAAGLAVVGLLATMVVPAYWPWSFARPSPPDPGAWATDATRTPAVVDRSAAMQMTHSGEYDPRRPIRSVHAPLTLAGLPADMSQRMVGVRATWTLADGTTIRSSQTGQKIGRVELRSSTMASGVPIRGALGDVNLLNAADPRGWEPWPTLLSLSEEQYARYRGRTGRFSAQVDFPLMRTTVRGALPLRAGAALADDTSRIEVIRVERRTDAYALTVRRWRANSMLTKGSQREHHYVLRNPRDRSVVVSNRGSYSDFGGGSVSVSGPLGLPLLLLGGAGGPASEGFSMQTEAFLYPLRIDFDGRVTELDEAWFQAAELVVLETNYAGTVTRPLVIEDFTIPER
jgi:hypothetical protein